MSSFKEEFFKDKVTIGILFWGSIIMSVMLIVSLITGDTDVGNNPLLPRSIYINNSEGRVADGSEIETFWGVVDSYQADEVLKVRMNSTVVPIKGYNLSRVRRLKEDFNKGDYILVEAICKQGEDGFFFSDAYLEKW